MPVILLITIIGLLTFCRLSAGDVAVSVQPQPVMVGESAVLQMVSSQGIPDIDQMPEIKGLIWLGPPSQNSQIQMINFQTTKTFILSYRFRIEKAGEYRIPSIKAKLKNKKVLLPATVIKAVERKFVVKNKAGEKGQEKTLDSLLFLKTQVLSNRESFYVGEEIPLEIRIYSSQKIRAEVPYFPSIEVSDDLNVIFRDYSSINEHSNIVTLYQQMEDRIGGEAFHVIFCRAKFRAISAGRLAGKVKVKVRIVVPRSRQSRNRRDPFSFFEDDFFGGAFSRFEKFEKGLSADLPGIQIKPLPTPPAMAQFLGLVGSWRVKYELTGGGFKTGEPLTLKIKVQGDGSLDNLHAPKLDLPGFRMFPPEIIRTGSAVGRETGEIRYVMIPLQEGPMQIDLVASTFSPTSKKYLEAPFHKTIKVAKGSTPVALVSELGDDPEAQVREPKRGNGLLYLKKGGRAAVDIPLWHNHAFLMVFFLLFGPIVWGLAEFLNYRQLMFGRDPALRRKLQARRRKGKVVAAIQKTAPEQVHTVIQNEVVPYLNDLLALPPGSHAGEVADQVDDRELAAILREGENGAYLPGSSSPADLRDRLLRVLKKSFILVFTLMLFLPFLHRADAEDNPWALYDRGEFKPAAKLFAQRQQLGEPDPMLLYNLGNCYYQMGELPRSLVYFEQARRLAPRDTDIRENLNHVRRKLMLPEIGKTNHPLDLLVNLRDQLRPDEWLLLLAAAWSVAGILLAVRRRLGALGWILPLAVSIAIILICLTATLFQYSTNYSRDAALVVKRGVPVYILPSDSARQADYKLFAGESVKIVEKRQDDWLRVRTENTEGWIKKGALNRVWPY